MHLNQWLNEITKKEQRPNLDDEFVFFHPETGRHYLTVSEIDSFVLFRFSLFSENTWLNVHEKALILNSNPSMLCKASLAIGAESDVLILSVFSQIENGDQFQNFWEEAASLRQSIIECLE